MRSLSDVHLSDSAGSPWPQSASWHQSRGQGNPGLIESAIEAGVVGPQTEVILTTDHPAHCTQLFSGQELSMNHFMIAKLGSRFVEIYLSSVQKAFTSGNCRSEPVSTTGGFGDDPLDRRSWWLRGTSNRCRAIHSFPDMNLRFPGRGAFHEVIADGTWRERFRPYFVHCWWHNFHNDQNMLQEYGDSLFEGLP